MPSTGPRAKQWCFTLNNYTPLDLDRLSSPPPEEVVYLIYGKEVGSSGTPHLQGTVCFQSRKRLNQVIQIIGQAHCSVTRNLLQSIEYCKKEGDFLEYGEVPQGKGGRTDLEDFKTSVKDGIVCMKELRDLHSEVCAKFPQFVKDYVTDWRTQVQVKRHPLRQWQQDLYEKLIVTPTGGEELEKFEREIVFIVDLTGNQGKSWFCRYYCDLHENAQIIVPGKKADMALVLREDCRVLFFDCPRSKQGDFIQYDLLEEIKNGFVFSGKYQSVIKKFKTPHVVVCMNEPPDMTKLSEDRYTIITLS
jgi:hypothetical protein